MYKSYKDFIKLLKSKQDKNYKDFHQKLTFTKYEIIGIRVPVLRKIAKEIIKSDYKFFLKEVQNKYYEEILIEGLVIASLEFGEFSKYIQNFIKKIDNWAICDSFCNSLKFIKNNPGKYFDYFKSYIASNDEFTIRVGLVIFLNYYISQEYIEKIFELLDNIKADKYYVNMAIAWLLAEMYIKYPSETRGYLSVTKINDFTFNKTISKICDSYRVSREIKEELKKLRR